METITQFEDNCFVVRIPIGIEQIPVFEATRRCWRASLRRAEKADYVLGIDDDVVKIVIKVTSCNYTKIEICNKEKETRCIKTFAPNGNEQLQRTRINLCDRRRRIAFEGEEIKDDTKYLHKRIPGEYMPGQNPVKYTYK